MTLKIATLMSQPLAKRNLGWLQDALQSAVELELSTLPPYFCGAWALKDQSSEAAALIKSIALDEMGHLGLACNLLTATGVQPKIFDGYDEIVYPGQLPGGVRPKCDPTFFPCDPNFQVVLGFNDFHSFTQMCMQIEYPEDPVPRPRLFELDEETFPSIGEFYDAVLMAFQDLDGTFPYQTERQLQNDFPEVVVINNLKEATAAIESIQKQGEGSSRFPFVDPEKTKLAHFYTFGELYFRKKYVFDETTQTGDWKGEDVTLPDVFPMTPVPPGGYTSGPSEVGDCDKSFTLMLQQLDQAWAGVSGALDQAVGSMFNLRTKAIGLLKKQVSRPEGGIYGPQFRKVHA